MHVELFSAKQCGSAKCNFKYASVFYITKCLLFRQTDAICRAIGPAITHSFLICGVLLVPIFLAHYVPRNRTRTRYAQKLQG